MSNQEIKDYCKSNPEAWRLATVYMEDCENEFIEQDELAFNSFIEGHKACSELITLNEK